MIKYECYKIKKVKQVRKLRWSVTFVISQNIQSLNDSMTQLILCFKGQCAAKQPLTKNKWLYKVVIIVSSLLPANLQTSKLSICAAVYECCTADLLHTAQAHLYSVPHWRHVGRAARRLSLQLTLSANYQHHRLPLLSVVSLPLVTIVSHTIIQAVSY